MTAPEGPIIERPTFEEKECPLIPSRFLAQIPHSRWDQGHGRTTGWLGKVRTPGQELRKNVGAEGTVGRRAAPRGTAQNWPVLGAQSGGRVGWVGRKKDYGKFLRWREQMLPLGGVELGEPEIVTL